MNNVKYFYTATVYAIDSVNDIHPCELQLMIDYQMFFEILSVNQYRMLQNEREMS